MDWHALGLTLLSHLPGALPAIVAAFYAWRAKSQVTRLHVQINSRMDDWLKAAQAVAHAEGVTEGRGDRTKL